MTTMTPCVLPSLESAPRHGKSLFGRMFLALASGCLTLGLKANVAGGEGSADLVKRGKGFRASLLATDPTLGILPPDGRETVSIHFVYLNAGEYLNVGSSAQGVGQGKIVYRDPLGMSGRCDPEVGLIPTLAVEKAGLAAGEHCMIQVEPGLEGIWEVEFVPPSPKGSLESSEPIFARDEWPAQSEDDAWVTAWDITVSSQPLKEGGIGLPGRTFLRTFSAIIGEETDEGQPRNTIWFGRSSEGYVYALDTNGMKAHALNLFGSTRGLKNEDGESIYGSRGIEELGETAFLADPYAFGPSARDETLKLFYTRSDQSLPATAPSALMGSEWLNRPINPVQK